MVSPNDNDNESGLKALIEHLVELRDRLLRIVMVLGAVFILLSPFVQTLYDWLSIPLIQHLPQGEKLIAVGVASPFLIPFKLALLVAFLLTLPYAFYQLWGFIAPGLYQHEKRLITPLLVSSVALFYIGMAFAYFVVIPMIARAAVAFAPNNVNPTPDIAEYLDFSVAMFLAFGLSFETPVATILLIGMGVVSVDTLTKARPYIIVGAFVVAMFLTPPDVVSQILMAVPIWLLFELGLVLSKLFSQHVDRFREEKAAHEANQERAMFPSAMVGTTQEKKWEDDKYDYEEYSFKSKPAAEQDDLDAEFDKAEKSFEQLNKDAENKSEPKAD